MNTIYILLTHSGSLLSRWINKYTKEPYTHVSIALDINLKELYSFGRIYPSNPLIGGFVKEDIKNGTYARFPNTMCALYSLKIDDIQYNKLRKELHRFKINSDNYAYNLMGLFGVMLNYPLEREGHYFCSQFVATLLKNSGIRDFKKPISLISPKDFREWDELKLVYEGAMRYYTLEEKLV